MTHDPTAHAIQRANQRYRIDLTPDDLAAMEYLIGLDHAQVVRLDTGDDGRSLVAFRWHHRWLALGVWRGRIMTFLPEPALNRHRTRLRRRIPRLLSEGLERYRPLAKKGGVS